MKFTGERFVPNINEHELEIEHFQRYDFAKQIITDKIILDAACGEGYGTNILSQEASKVYGIDISKEAIEHASKKYNSENIQFINSSIEKLPFDDEIFDVVVSFETIEHVDEEIQQKFLSEVKRVLKNDGIFLISTPNKKIYSDIPNYKNEFHVKEFYKEEYITFLKKYFNQVELFSQYFEVTSNIENIQSNICMKDSRYMEENAKYFIGICSKSEISIEINSSLYIDNQNKYQANIKRILDLQNEVLDKNIHISLLDNQVKNSDIEIKRLNNHIEEISQWSKKLDKEIKNHKEEIKNHKEEIKNHKEEIKNYKLNLYKNKEEINSIYNSTGWKLLIRLYKVRDFILPQNSKRRFLMKLAKKAIKNPKVYINRLNKDNIKKLKYYIKNEDLERINDRLNCFDEKHIVSNIKEIKITEVEDGSYEKIIFDKVDNPLVSIIIPVYNQWNYTYSCLKSIKENTSDISYEIIITDDVSNDLTKDIKIYIENINVIRNEENLGFLLNCNNAAKHARGKYIHFLNNDTNVQENWLSSLVELIEKDEKIGMVGSKLVYSNGKLQEAGGIIWNDASGWNYGRLDDPSKSEYNYVKEVDYISGASIMISKSLWSKLDGFDERYVPAYYEDTDLAFEVRNAGYKVVYQPKSVVVHFEGISHGTDETSGIKSYQVKNKEKFIQKWNGALRSNHFNNAEKVFLARDRSNKKETVLVVDHYVPHYDKDAGSRVVFNYINLLCDMGLNVKFIGDNFFKHEPYTTELEQLGVEVLYGNYYNKNWKRWIKDNGQNIDYVLLNRPHISIKYIDAIKEYTNAKIVYFVHDLHFVRELKEYKLTKNEDILKSSNEWKKKELKLMEMSDVVFTLSKDEKAIINEELNCEKAVISPMYSYKEFKENKIDISNKHDLIFVGGFNHKPNEDGVLWFMQEIWPIVNEKLPNIKFRIVGSNPTEKIKSLACENVIVTGFVSDEELEQLYDKSRICVIPLRFGAGVKGKTLEAMYNCIPIISTSIGIEGLDQIHKYIKSYDAPECFANQIIEVYKNEDELLGISEKYKLYLEEYFSYEYSIQFFKLIFNDK